MRRWNAYISLAILLLLLAHAVAGAYQMLGVFPGGNQVLQIMAWTMLGLMAVHGMIGVKLTVDTFLACRKAKISYFKENLDFHIRRISGFAILVLGAYHVIVFMGRTDGGYRLSFFGGGQLAASILLAVALLLHIVTNIKPLMVALGTSRVRRFLLECLWVLALVVLFCAGAFVVYYLRWNVFWR